MGWTVNSRIRAAELAFSAMELEERLRLRDAPKALVCDQVAWGCVKLLQAMNRSHIGCASSIPTNGGPVVAEASVPV